MLKLRWGVLVALSSCYRGEPAPAPAHNTVAVAAPSPACGPDDRAHPVIDPGPELRLRMHVNGPLSSAATSSNWAGPAVPDYIPMQDGARSLFVLDEVEGGHLALYRTPYGTRACAAGSATNCDYEARAYDANGRVRWTLDLGTVFSRPDRIEVQDVRYVGGVLYFNEACQSYSSGAHGKCSSLVAVDPERGRVLWRTPHLVSNGRFVVRGCYIVAGYGFTGEPDFLYLLDRATGRLLEKHWVSTAPQQYHLRGDDALDVELYSGAQRRFRLRDFDRRDGALVPLDAPEVGGDGYGGYGAQLP